MFHLRDQLEEPQAPWLHILTLLTVKPRCVPLPHVGYQIVDAFQKSRGADVLLSPHGLLATWSLLQISSDSIP